VVNVALGVEIDRDGAADKLLRVGNVIAIEIITSDFLAIDFDLDGQLRHMTFSPPASKRIPILCTDDQYASARLSERSPTDNGKHCIVTDPVKGSMLSADEPKDRKIANLLANT